MEKSKLDLPAMRNQRRVAVVVPAYAEEELITATLAGIPPWVDAIYVVDDHSPDQTRERVRAHADPRVELLCHSENRGVGRAIATGTQHAFAQGAEFIAVMAGDNQMDPADLDAVLAPLCEDRADYVKGNRFLHPELHRMPRLRRWGSRALGYLTSYLAQLPLTDSQCGYTAMNRRAAAAIPWETVWDGYGYPNDLLILLGRRGLRVTEVSVRPVYGTEKSGLRPWHVLTILRVMIRRLRLERLSSL